MSRAREIKDKMELQAKFQLAMSNKNAMVLNWLKTDSKSVDENLETSKTDFFNLPVVQAGAGLSLASAHTHDAEDIHTIGEFISSDKKVSTLSKKKQLDKSKQNSIHRVHKDDSKAMVALKNKMRDQSRQNIRKELNSKPQARVQNDSDSDEEAPVQKTTKKKQNFMQFGKKKK